MIYDDFAKQAVDDYNLFLMALEARYRAIIGPGVLITPAVIKGFSKECDKLYVSFLNLMERSVGAYTQSVCEERTPATFTAEFVLMVGLRKAAIENCVQMSKALRSRALTGAGVLKRVSGGLGLLLQRKLGEVEFVVYDTANRKWDAKRLVKTVVRDFAYQMWIDAVAAQLVKDGHALAQVRYDDPSKAEREVIISLGDKPGVYGTWADARREIFHTNSTARLTPYVPTK